MWSAMMVLYQERLNLPFMYRALYTNNKLDEYTSTITKISCAEQKLDQEDGN